MHSLTTKQKLQNIEERLKVVEGKIENLQKERTGLERKKEKLLKRLKSEEDQNSEEIDDSTEEDILKELFTDLTGQKSNSEENEKTSHFS